ncbi:MAG TPA: polysaccharide deacetylase family protein [Solirubrobacteraceae bacterium]|nr:polysaccharide deacetylase family protein [Solirubrobacteraceae bacterium]
MDQEGLTRRRAERARERRRRQRRRRLGASASLVLIAAVAVVIVVAALSGHRPRLHPGAPRDGSHHAVRRAHSKRVAHVSRGVRTGARIGPATGHPGAAVAPILMYHVINPPPPGAPFPGLYVPSDEFLEQMLALKHAGYHPVTLDDLWANWRHGNRLPSKPIVITFDNGYRSQYTNARPILRRLHWTAVLNTQLSGLPPSQGGLTTAQFRGLLAAGWELDTQGISHADLVTEDAAGLRYQIDHARTTLQRRFHVPVRWFCYPSGQYDSAVIDAVRAAGFVGSTTVVPGWASRADDPFALPRLRVLGGTTGPELLAQIAAARDAPAPPSAYETS